MTRNIAEKLCMLAYANLETVSKLTIEIIIRKLQYKNGAIE